MRTADLSLTLERVVKVADQRAGARALRERSALVSDRLARGPAQAGRAAQCRSGRAGAATKDRRTAIRAVCVRRGVSGIESGRAAVSQRAPLRAAAVLAARDGAIPDEGWHGPPGRGVDRLADRPVRGVSRAAASGAARDASPVRAVRRALPGVLRGGAARRDADGHACSEAGRRRAPGRRRAVRVDRAGSEERRAQLDCVRLQRHGQGISSARRGEQGSRRGAAARRRGHVEHDATARRHRRAAGRAGDARERVARRARRAASGGARRSRSQRAVEQSGAGRGAPRQARRLCARDRRSRADGRECRRPARHRSRVRWT